MRLVSTNQETTNRDAGKQNSSIGFSQSLFTIKNISRKRSTSHHQLMLFEWGLIQQNSPQQTDTAERLLTVGRFVEKKGIGYAIDAVASLVDKYPDIEYHLVSDGPLRDELRTKSNRKGSQTISHCVTK